MDYRTTPLNGADAADRQAYECAVELAIQSNGRDAAALLEEVSRRVRAAKARSTPPQEVIVWMKTELQRHAVARMEPRAFAELSTRVVKRAIDEYYRG